jgi:hypothetical protein
VIGLRPIPDDIEPRDEIPGSSLGQIGLIDPTNAPIALFVDRSRKYMKPVSGKFWEERWFDSP